jgi:hypothetical protein
MQDWRANMATISTPGGLNSPGTASLVINYLGSVISLQTVFALFRDDPRIYNPLAYLVCGVMLAAWSARTLRSGFSQTSAWLALAAVAPVTMLVTYHRSYDAKLLLLTVPACAMLWARGGAIRWMALSVNTAGIVLTADFPLTILMMSARNVHIASEGFVEKILAVARMRPAPLMLLVMSIFYLCVYMRPAVPVFGGASDIKVTPQCHSKIVLGEAGAGGQTSEAGNRHEKGNSLVETVSPHLPLCAVLYRRIRIVQWVLRQVALSRTWSRTREFKSRKRHLWIYRYGGRNRHASICIQAVASIDSELARQGHPNGH